MIRPAAGPMQTERICAICGSPFLVSSRIHKIYCTAKCRSRARTIVRRGQRRERAPVVRASPADSPWADGTLEMRLEEMRDNGMSFRAIAEAIGMTKSQVVGKANRLGMLKRQRPRSPVVEFPSRDRCVYPLGHPGEDGFHFCAAAIKEGSPYCVEHYKLCYVVPNKAAEAA